MGNCVNTLMLLSLTYIVGNLVRTESVSERTDITGDKHNCIKNYIFLNLLNIMYTHTHTHTHIYIYIEYIIIIIIIIIYLFQLS